MILHSIVFPTARFARAVNSCRAGSRRLGHANKSCRKFVLYSCLLCFFILLPLRFDGTIELNYALVFLPLWICEFVVFLGAVIAAISFTISPPSSTESSLRSDFYGMILCTGEHGLLTLFGVLCCHKLQTNATIDELPWLLVFVPIFALSLLSVVVAIWAIRNDKSFELELFFSVNIVQFVFIAFKLDGILDWHWTIVFIPLWVVLSLSVVGVSLLIVFMKAMINRVTFTHLISLLKKN
ncbi:unnamed protein product [Onchocerca flexuosa]|uniref:Uncharacterized protein n=1 Tax=Onchocerca flexuosa TaxID=387005 RepID=A0A183H5Y8_9BILA|nr:unnamed protein product [Onchocerca flexuosa]